MNAYGNKLNVMVSVQAIVLDQSNNLQHVFHMDFLQEEVSQRDRPIAEDNPNMVGYFVFVHDP
ncbi:hypothetical protein RUM44_004087 [Polyplax serrata]|uniref:Uncharacterized protein n=1 Tax=Polyplax serrata TaxID=468196 RepID=A0ABR1B1V6_POLSC